MSTNLFAGANTPIGFVDFFNNIMPVTDAKTRLFLKGSSGSGKSTLMKKIANMFEKRGLDVERFYCSNDIESLDAIAVPSIGLSIIDATAPHSHDPEIAIAIDKVLDCAQFIDENKLGLYLDELKSLSVAKKLLSKKISSYLSAIGGMYEAHNNAFEGSLDKFALKKHVHKCLDTLFADAQTDLQNVRFGHCRKLFLSAVTPDGFISFADSFFKNSTVYGVSCDVGIGVNIFFDELKNLAITRGINVTCFYNPISPALIEYLYFPQISTVFARTDGRFAYDGTCDKTVVLNDCIDREILEAVSVFEPDCDLFDRLLNHTVSAMCCARKLHARTEEIYVPTMDFDSLNRATETIMQDLLLLCDARD